MSSSFNKVILMGNLTREPELRFIPSGTAVCNVGLAVNRRYKSHESGEWKDEVSFIDLTIWGKRGEAFAKYHTKGKPAFVEGYLRMETWDDKQTGARRSKLTVTVENWEFVGSGDRDRAPIECDTVAGRPIDDGEDEPAF